MQVSGVPGPLLQNLNLQMARDEYELNGQQGLDQLLSVLGGEEVQVAPCLQSVTVYWRPDLVCMCSMVMGSLSFQCTWLCTDWMLSMLNC